MLYEPPLGSLETQIGVRVRELRVRELKLRG